MGITLTDPKYISFCSIRLDYLLSGCQAVHWFTLFSNPIKQQIREIYSLAFALLLPNLFLYLYIYLKIIFYFTLMSIFDLTSTSPSLYR